MPPTLVPQELNTDSYSAQVQLGDFNMLRSFRNSFVISTSAMLISLVLAIPASYGVGRFSFKGKRLLILSFLVTQMLPVSVLLTPMFITFRNLHILNNPLSAILADATIGIPFSVLILMSYFASIPGELTDASRIDGCNRFPRLPVSCSCPSPPPGWSVPGLLLPLRMGGPRVRDDLPPDQTLRPITAGMFNFLGQYGTKWSYLTAFAVVTTVPVVLIFIFMQKYIIRGLTAVRSRAEEPQRGDTTVAVSAQNGRLVRRNDDELLWIEPWEKAGFVCAPRAAPAFGKTVTGRFFPGRRRAPSPPPTETRDRSRTAISWRGYTIAARISFFNSHGTLLLEERWRTRSSGEPVFFHGSEGPGAGPVAGDMFRVSARFEARDDERIFGMGQYQDGRLDLKGSALELAHRNSQASVPSFLSNKGYGLLWNNPAIGRATFAANGTEFVAEQSSQLDYWDHDRATPRPSRSDTRQSAARFP